MPSAWCCRMMRPSTATSRRRPGGLARHRTGTWRHLATDPPDASRRGSLGGRPGADARHEPSPVARAVAVKAALLVEPGRIEVDDVPSPTPGPDEVRIAVAGVGLCGSDLSVFRGAWDAPTYPWIMGHEAFGTIEAVGQAVPVDEARRDRRHRAEHRLRHMRACRRGRTSACTHRQSVGMNRPGSIAEQVVVPTQHAWRVTDRIAEDLVCIEPMTVVETALRRLRARCPLGAGRRGRRPGVAHVPCPAAPWRRGRRGRRQPGADRVRGRAGRRGARA